ncbi:MAG: tRNA (adenosine(37)-N6)-threonylcarbamoyltransferase complex ATPase subunit type 1 TsaE [Candidatus Omnitrophica bacterium]|nr:tRNA (adenosine(37)-N6)-threonylcarbamoyltransferase complex ATPase subunit type 1 TsaE [Candidatus Omnitrophota bacterium]
MHSLKISSHSEKETINLGRKLVGLLGRGDIVCLFGTLGAGKTVLVKGMARGLGIKRNQVISPSFVLMREYSARVRNKRMPFYHFDLYRLTNIKQILDLGYEEYLFGQGISVIEWAERMMGYMPGEFLKIKLEIRGSRQRNLKLSSNSRRYQKLLHDLESKI